MNLLRCLKQRCVNKKVQELLEQKEKDRAPFVEASTVPVSGEEPAVEVCDWFPNFTYNDAKDEVLLTTLHVSTIWAESRSG